MKIDLENTIKKFGGKWVLIDDKKQKVISSSKNVKTLYKDGKKRGFKTPYLFKVPTKLTPYIG